MTQNEAIVLIMSYNINHVEKQIFSVFTFRYNILEKKTTATL